MGMPSQATPKEKGKDRRRDTLSVSVRHSRQGSSSSSHGETHHTRRMHNSDFSHLPPSPSSSSIQQFPSHVHDLSATNSSRSKCGLGLYVEARLSGFVLIPLKSFIRSHSNLRPRHSSNKVNTSETIEVNDGESKQYTCLHIRPRSCTLASRMQRFVCHGDADRASVFPSVSNCFISVALVLCRARYPMYCSTSGIAMCDSRRDDPLRSGCSL